MLCFSKRKFKSGRPRLIKKLSEKLHSKKKFTVKKVTLCYTKICMMHTL